MSPHTWWSDALRHPPRLFNIHHSYPHPLLLSQREKGHHEKENVFVLWRNGLWLKLCSEIAWLEHTPLGDDAGD